MKNINYSVLVHRELTGELTSNESAMLNEWLAADSSHPILAENIRNIWIASQSKVSGWEPDVEGGLKRLQERIAEDEKSKTPKRPLIFSLLRYAAAAMLVVSLGYF